MKRAGKSKTEYGFHLIDADAILALAQGPSVRSIAVRPR